MALAMFLYEGERYKLITPTDCVSHLLYKRDHSFIEEDNKVRDASRANNGINMWVKESILKSSKIESRKNVLTFFMRTAFVRHPILSFFSPILTIRHLAGVSKSSQLLFHVCNLFGNRVERDL